MLAEAGGPARPRVVDRAADDEFRALARAMGNDPDNVWVGGYVDYEWAHVRHFLAAYAADLDGRAALEFGCNIGATAIVLAALGAVVTAIDVDARAIALATINARRHGHTGIAFLQVGDTALLPFASGQFDLITCNSVLEYVPPPRLPAILGEIDRVLAPSGVLIITGTSNRLAPREVHSRRWLVNYVPRAIEQAVTRSQPMQRGVWPWRVRGGFRSYRDLVREDGGRAYGAASRAAGASPAKLAILRGLHAVGQCAGWSAGMMTPNLFLALRKPAADRPADMRARGDIRELTNLR